MIGKINRWGGSSALQWQQKMIHFVNRFFCWLIHIDFSIRGFPDGYLLTFLLWWSKGQQYGACWAKLWQIEGQSEYYLEFFATLYYFLDGSWGFIMQKNISIHGINSGFYSLNSAFCGKTVSILWKKLSIYEPNSAFLR